MSDIRRVVVVSQFSIPSQFKLFHCYSIGPMTKVSSTTEDNATDQPFSPDQALPPVEVPTAGFILQLFVIPAIIVVIIATVWLLFSWVAHLGSSPEKLVQDLVRGGDHRWQTAWNLAKELQKPGNASFRQNQELASRLATLLQDTLEVPYPTGNSPQDQSERKSAIQSRVFLCRALGEFELSLVIPALAAAAKREDYVAQSADDFGDIYVRQSAIEAIAVLAQNFKLTEQIQVEEIRSAVYAAASERSDSSTDGGGRDKLRSAAAYALGVMGDKRDLDRLAIMCQDSVTNVRYNSATGLARHGDIRSLETLLEMIDLDQTQAVRREREESGREWKRNSIIINGLRASEQLVHANPTADLDQLESAIERLLNGNANGRLQAQARRALEQFNHQKTQQ
ncbi:MAG: hypothetical protein CMJ62_08565 [Planctomycetaceae bacterium]|nr:hypothetical protein [Planctomycetaceae bacterium]